MKTFKFAVNTHGINKDWDFNVLSARFEDKTGTVEDVLRHAKQGHALNAGLFGGQWRCKANVIGSQLALLDIDNSDVVRDADGKPVKDEDGKTTKIYSHQLTLDEAIAHPFIRQYAAFIYTTASHTADWPKFRIGFVLPELITDTDEYESLVRYLMELLPHDPSCKDASRVFYGSTGATFPLVNGEVTLPAEWVQQARAAAAKAKAERQQQLAEAERRRAKFREQAQAEGWDVDALVDQALAFIPPRQPGSNNYDECRSVLMALVDHYGATEAEAIAERWSPSIKGSTWNIPHKIASFRRSGVTIGTLFHIAKGYGFRFPKKSWLDQIGDRLNRKPTPKKSAQALKVVLGDKPFTGDEYEPGLRAAVWQVAIGQGYKHILDLSGTGSGKSHTAGELQPADFGDNIKQLLYISNGHYAPTTETLKDWADLHGRHNGLTREATTGGSRLRRAKRGEDRVIPANCSRNGVINALRAKNINGADSASVVCGTCPLLDVCRHSQGKGYGFLNQRKLALSSPRLRLHPSSAPGTDYEYNKAIALWDEPSESFKVTQAVEVTAEDVRQTTGHLAMTSQSIFAQLRPLLAALGALFEAKQGRYGIDHQAIMAALPPLPDGLDVEAVKAALTPDLKFLDPEVEDGLRVSDLPARSFKMAESQYGRGDGGRVNLRSHFSEDTEAQVNKAEGVIKQWLLDLVQVLQSGAGALHLAYETLTVTRPDYRLRAVANATAGNIYLDATLSVDDLALVLDCAPSDIYVCRERPQATGGKLTITQVADLGRVTMSRGKDQDRRIAALVQHYRETASDAKVIDFKKFGSDGAWWRDSRGVNDFESITTLLLVGTPCRNLAALQAEYSCLTGAFPAGDDERFKAWVDRIIAADMVQGIGRLRANRRTGEQLHIVLVSDFDLGIPTTHVAAKDITVAAASKVERVEMAIAAAVEHLQASGAKVTQAAVAQVIGASQGYVARFKKLLQTLLGDSSSKSNNFLGADANALVWGALDLCRTPKDIANTVADLLSGLVEPIDLLMALAESPPEVEA